MLWNWRRQKTASNHKKIKNHRMVIKYFIESLCFFCNCFEIFFLVVLDYKALTLIFDELKTAKMDGKILRKQDNSKFKAFHFGIKPINGFYIRDCFPKLVNIILRNCFKEDLSHLGGNRGFGKSFFSFYLMHCIMNDIHDVWENETTRVKFDFIYDRNDGHFFYFNHDSMQTTYCDLKSVQKIIASKPSALKKILHIVYDSTGSQSPTFFTACFVFIASPRRFEQSSLHRELIDYRYYMPVWSLDELNEAYNMLFDDGDSESNGIKVKELFEIFGGNALDVLSTVHKSIETRKSEFVDRYLNPSVVDNYLNKHVKLNRSLTSDMACTLVHYRVNDKFSIIGLDLASELIRNTLKEAHLNFKESELLSLFSNPCYWCCKFVSIKAKN